MFRLSHPLHTLVRFRPVTHIHGAAEDEEHDGGELEDVALRRMRGVGGGGRRRGFTDKPDRGGNAPADAHRLPRIPMYRSGH